MPGPQHCHPYAKRYPHHLWWRTPELTIRINLIALRGILNLPDGRERFLCRCHRRIHDGQIEASAILSIVAIREKISVQEIVEVMQWMRRHVKPTPRQLEIALEELSIEGRLIAVKALTERPEKAQ
jgi:predicted protein tyrosine phosphatase